MFTGNKKKVMHDAPRIAARYRHTDVTLGALIAEYRCAYETMIGALLSQMTKAQYQRLAKKRLGRSTRTRFKPSLIPWNSGRKGWCPAGCEATQFKRGCMRGQAARNYRLIGTISTRHDHCSRRTQERINARPGPKRRYIKVKDDGKPQDLWIPLARYRWEKERGPIPRGMCVVHIDGNTLNDQLSNLSLADRAGNLKRLETIRPAAWQRCLKNRAEAARRRHAENRKLKAALGKLQTTWLCRECGESFETQPKQCPKCGKSNFEAVRRREHTLESDDVYVELAWVHCP